MKYEIKVLSLKKNTLRRDFMVSNFGKRYKFDFWDAIEGKTHKFTPQENQFFLNSEFHKYNCSVEACKAISLSNYNMWKYSVDNNINLVIFEDDVLITSNSWFNFDKMFEDNFDIHFLTNIKDFANCFAYMVTPQGAQKLIKHFNKFGFKDILDNDIRYLPKPQFKIRHELFNHFGTVHNHFLGSDVLLHGYTTHEKS
jgi:GR25 family glycosyltransferase involved in LPS biosynthesis|tara:strand:+ start:117 stop:710 length:594 start_codon:yes stop_codon:yes gene_type:complete